MSCPAGATRPELWKYVLGGLIALIVLIPLWTTFVMIVIEPESLTIQEQTMSNRLLWWVAGPAAVVGLFFGVHWMKASQNVSVGEMHGQRQVRQVVESDQTKREYVLEVIGLG